MMDLLRRDVTMQISRGWAVLTPCCQRKQISLHLLCFKSVFSCFTFKQAKSFEFLFIIFILSYTSFTFQSFGQTDNYLHY